METTPGCSVHPPERIIVETPLRMLSPTGAAMNVELVRRSRFAYHLCMGSISSRVPDIRKLQRVGQYTPIVPYRFGDSCGINPLLISLHLRLLEPDRRLRYAASAMSVSVRRIQEDKKLGSMLKI